MASTDTPRPALGKASVDFSSPDGVSPAPDTPRFLNRTPSLLRGKSVLPASETSVQVYLRVRPPQEEKGEIDPATGIPTIEVLPPAQPAAAAPATPAAAEGAEAAAAVPVTPSSDVVAAEAIATLPFTTVRSHPPVSSRLAVKSVKEFSFSRVFPAGCAQVDVYETTTKPLVEGLFLGHNALMFCYGMTNAGKTYTTLGDETNPGMLPRALEGIFEGVAAKAGAAAGSGGGSGGPRVVMSLLEIYNENVFDLLATDSESDWRKARENLKLQDRMGKIEPRNLSRHAISTPSAALDLLKRGASNRKVASTNLNEDSSRSHSVCAIEVEQLEGRSEPAVLWIVDLAGSERSTRTGASHKSDRQKEANNINLSLTILWRCLKLMRRNAALSALAMGGAGGSSVGVSTPVAAVIPFRESKLTHLFMNHLMGQSAGKTVMIVNINPSVADFDENQHVLANSAIAQEVKTFRDNKAALHQANLLNTAGGYGYDGRRLLRRKSRGGGRRSIHKPKAPKVSSVSKLKLGRTGSDRAVTNSSEGFETASMVDGSVAASEAGEGELSGAESDSALIDARQNMVLRIEDLEREKHLYLKRIASMEQQLRFTESEARQLVAADVAALVEAYDKRLDALQAEAKALVSAAAAAAGSGVSREYVSALEARVQQQDAELARLVAAHDAERAEWEAEFAGFCEENGLDDPAVQARYASLRETGDADAAMRAEVAAAQDDLKRAKEAERCHKAESAALRKEIEALKEQLANTERRLSPPKPLTRPGPLSPLSARDVARGNYTGRPSLERVNNNSSSRDEVENVGVGQQQQLGQRGRQGRGDAAAGTKGASNTSRNSVKPPALSANETPRQSIVAISRRSSVMRVSHGGGGNGTARRASSRPSASGRRHSRPSTASMGEEGQQALSKMERVAEKNENFFEKVRNMLLRMVLPQDEGSRRGSQRSVRIIKKRHKSLRPNKKPLDPSHPDYVEGGSVEPVDEEEEGEEERSFSSPNAKMVELAKSPDPHSTIESSPHIVEDYVC